MTAQEARNITDNNNPDISYIMKEITKSALEGDCSVYIDLITIVTEVPIIMEYLKIKGFRCSSEPDYLIIKW